MRRNIGLGNSDVSLFSFLGVFVCLIGVFGFLDVCLYLTGRQVEVQIKGLDKSRIPFQIECHGTLLLRNPDLHAVRDDLPANAKPEVAAAIHRLKTAHPVERMAIDKLSALNSPLVQLVKDLDLLNRDSALKGSLWSGYLILAVYPDGVSCYWTTMQLLRRYPAIQVGITPMLSGWALGKAGR